MPIAEIDSYKACFSVGIVDDLLDSGGRLTFVVDIRSLKTRYDKTTRIISQKLSHQNNRPCWLREVSQLPFHWSSCRQEHKFKPQWLLATPLWLWHLSVRCESYCSFSKCRLIMTADSSAPYRSSIWWYKRLQQQQNKHTEKRQELQTIVKDTNSSFSQAFIGVPRGNVYVYFARFRQYTAFIEHCPESSGTGGRGELVVPLLIRDRVHAFELLACKLAKESRTCV